MRKSLVFAFLLVAAPAFSQTIIPNEYVVTAHRADAPDGTPVTTYTFQASTVACNQAVVALAGAVAVNPRYLRWTDPSASTKDCVWDIQSATNPLFAWPPAGTTYVMRLLAVLRQDGQVYNASSASNPSNPFVRGGPANVQALRIGG